VDSATCMIGIDTFSPIDSIINFDDSSRRSISTIDVGDDFLGNNVLGIVGSTVYPDMQFTG
jgi:hypothetical protein